MTTPAPTSETQGCFNCSLFVEDKSGIEATEVETGLAVVLGRRMCVAGNVAWANSRCVTGQWVARKPEAPVEK